MKKPMDAEMATLMFLGIMRTIRSRMPKMLSNYEDDAGDQDDGHGGAKGELAALDHAPSRKLVPMPVDRAKGKLE